MAQSTTTLLQAVNRVLRDVGERRVSAINSPASEKARDYLQEALQFLVAVHDWEWLYNRVTASTWLGDSFNLPTAQQIRGVAWVTNVGTFDLQYVEVRQFDLNVSQPFLHGLGFLHGSGISTRPLYYTIPSYQTVRVNPYPINDIGQGSIVAYIIEELQPPQTETALFPIPEKYMQLVIKKADYYMAMHHLEDSNSAQFFDKDFNELLQRYRTQENKTPTGGYNMYRQRTRRYLGGL